MPLPISREHKFYVNVSLDIREILYIDETQMVKWSKVNQVEANGKVEELNEEATEACNEPKEEATAVSDELKKEATVTHHEQNEKSTETVSRTCKETKEQNQVERQFGCLLCPKRYKKTMHLREHYTLKHPTFPIPSDLYIYKSKKRNSLNMHPIVMLKRCDS